MGDPAPLAAALRTTARRGRCHNFHALPWSGALSGMDDELEALYRELLGAGLERTDGSWSGAALDSFFRPHGPLDQAQRRAAEAFGADATFFGSGGTSLANRIAVAALGCPGGRVLLDAAAHQSLRFAVDGLDVTRAPVTADGAGPRHLDVPGTTRLLAARSAQGTPFDLLVITAAGYDGYRLRLDRALPLLAAASPTTALLVDEAWSAIHAFAPGLAERTALAVGRILGAEAPIVVTQSAHKSMAALRQGSYLHVLGGPEVVRRVGDAVFRLHTTSPSWPILSSLDLAREHAQRHGTRAVSSAVALRRSLVTRLRADPRTAAVPVAPTATEFADTDPMVVRLAVDEMGEPRAVREWLYARHNVYLARGAADGLLAHCHIGVDESDTAALAEALTELATRPFDRSGTESAPAVPAPVVGARVDGYVIPYPPGVPIAHPGEVWTRAHAEELNRERATGADIFHVPG